MRKNLIVGTMLFVLVTMSMVASAQAKELSVGVNVAIGRGPAGDIIARLNYSPDVTVSFAYLPPPSPLAPQAKVRPITLTGVWEPEGQQWVIRDIPDSVNNGTLVITCPGCGSVSYQIVTRSVFDTVNSWRIYLQR